MPFTEYQAERAATNGTLLGPDRTFTTVAAEAVDRQAVRLAGRGRFVEFTLGRPANAVDVHYAVPDSADGTPHHFFDDVRLLLGGTLPAGTRVRLRVPDRGAAPWYALDLADFEQVGPPLAAPPDALSVLDFGADPTGRTDSTQAIQQAINASNGRTVWLPPGNFTVTSHLIVDR